MQISFLGAAGTVTGSKFLLEQGETRLLVDCGLFQGLKNLRLKNWGKLPIDPKTLSGVILTHAHIDHSGYIPKLIKDGFTKEVHCTLATQDLCKILLPDCGYIQEEDARYANQRGFSKHKPALPLYTADEAKTSLRQFVHHELLSPFEIGPFSIQFQTAGHILGAASVLIRSKGRSIFFSGDLGRPNDLLIKPPAPLPPCDYLVLESTYGDRTHASDDPIDLLEGILRETLEKQSVVLIPSFAVGRAQVMLYALYRLFEKNPELKVPVYINSPMATSVTKLYEQHLELHKMDQSLCDSVCSLGHFVQSANESKSLNSKKGPMVIISASGMITGGRILHHMKEFAPDPKNIIVLPGFQAAGTRGASMIAGSKSVKIHGQYVPIKAKIFHLDLFSAHADQHELVQWLKTNPEKHPKKTFIVHGEPSASDSMRLKIQDELRYKVHIPEQGETVELL